MKTPALTVDNKTKNESCLSNGGSGLRYRTCSSYGLGTAFGRREDVEGKWYAAQKRVDVKICEN